MYKALGQDAIQVPIGPIPQAGAEQAAGIISPGTLPIAVYQADSALSPLFVPPPGASAVKVGGAVYAAPQAATSIPSAANASAPAGPSITQQAGDWLAQGYNKYYAAGAGLLVVLLATKRRRR